MRSLSTAGLLTRKSYKNRIGATTVNHITDPVILQLLSSLVVAGVSAWFGSWLGVRHALRKLRNEKAFERRLVWYEDTVAALIAVRDLQFWYAAATRQRDAVLLGQLAPQIGAAFATFGEKANKAILYAPSKTVRRMDTLVHDLMTLAPKFIQTLQDGKLYEEFAAQTDSLVATLTLLIFELAQEVRGELGIGQIEVSDLETKALKP